MAEKIRVLIIDDLALMREALRSIIERCPDLEVVGLAKNGREGLEKAFLLKPDVITMDLKLPLLSGLETIEAIMGENPTPIIIVSGIEIAVIANALASGAMDFVALASDLETISEDLTSKIRIASRVRPIRRMKAKPCAVKTPKAPGGHGVAKVVVIGISTGGPQALEQLFSSLPPDFPVGILVVQHISKGFIEGLAEWLNVTSCLKVSVARAGDVLKPGQIMLAPDNLHTRIDSFGRIVLSENTSKEIIYIPSIDVMMKSVADSYGVNAVGVIMTGMSQDGVEGIRAIRARGGRTLAQDEKTSVIYGMNKVAIDLGLIDKVAPLEKIAEELVNIVSE